MPSTKDAFIKYRNKWNNSKVPDVTSSLYTFIEFLQVIIMVTVSNQVMVSKKILKTPKFNSMRVTDFEASIIYDFG
jgi:hypothetical protein